MTAIKQLEDDLAWREAELAVLRVILANRELTKLQKEVLFRAAWALLYAHYEGFCKFALTVYYDEIAQTKLKLNSLAASIQCLALSKTFKKLRSLPAPELLSSILSFEATHMTQNYIFPDVDTDSNLWPSKLKELLADADLKLLSLSEYNQTISTLVKRRNKIAHGEQDFISDFEYYKKYESAVLIVVNELILVIDAKLTALSKTESSVLS